MWPVSAATLAALSQDHEMDTRVRVFNKAGLRASSVPIEGGTINATILADVCRSGSLTVARRFTDRGLFDPRQDRVSILTGPKGFPLIPIFTGRVMDTSRPAGGLVQVQVEDYGRDVVDALFEQPWQARTGSPVPEEMRRIIQDVDATFGVDLTRAVAGTTPNVTWEENRAQALDELAAATNAIWQSDRAGSFIVYPNPYSLTGVIPSVVTLSTGSSGTLTSFIENTTRDKVFNSITVLVERANNVPPLRVTVRDEGANSPFRWGGEFGKVNRVVRLQTPLNAGQAKLMAQRVLHQSLNLYRSWRLSTPHFPLLDPGDVITVVERGVTSTQVVESISYPLRALDDTAIATRELRQEMEVN